MLGTLAVKKTKAGGAAANAGVLVGDILVAVDETSLIACTKEEAMAILKLQTADTVVLQVNQTNKKNKKKQGTKKRKGSGWKWQAAVSSDSSSLALSIYLSLLFLFCFVLFVSKVCRERVVRTRLARVESQEDSAATASGFERRQMSIKRRVSLRALSRTQSPAKALEVADKGVSDRLPAQSRESKQ